jgi:hypothetical protein
MDGIAKVGAPSEVEIARATTRRLEFAMRCEDPVERSRLAIYVGGEAHTWYLPPGSAYGFFDDAIVIFPRGLNGGKQSTYAVGWEFFDGFPEHNGIKPAEFRIYYGYDPEHERHKGRSLPVHFHWIVLDEQHPAVHCSTEPLANNIVRIDVYRADPKRIIP